MCFHTSDAKFQLVLGEVTIFFSSCAPLFVSVFFVFSMESSVNSLTIVEEGNWLRMGGMPNVVTELDIQQRELGKKVVFSDIPATSVDFSFPNLELQNGTSPDGRHA